MAEEFLIKKTVNAYHCLRCGHEWIPRVSMEELEGTIKEKPRICPNCKSAYWDVPKKNKSANSPTTKRKAR
jgi:DNA-directed RNA polymerase subunit RPC12/RpoP